MKINMMSVFIFILLLPLFMSYGIVVILSKPINFIKK